MCDIDGIVFKYYYIPIGKILINFIVDQTIINNVNNEKLESVSPYVRASGMVNTVRLIIYGDDFGFANPIGVSRRNQKMFSVYLDIDNLAHYHTKVHDLPLVLIANRMAIKECSMDSVLAPLVADLKSLEVCVVFVMNNANVTKIFSFIDQGIENPQQRYNS